MGQWWILLLVVSQATLRHSVVDATFDVGLRWLRGDTSLFFGVVNMTTTTESAPTLSTLQDVANTTATGDALNERRTKLSVSTTPTVATPADTTQFVDPTTTTEVQPQESRSEPAPSPATTTVEATTGTTAVTSPLTPLLIENATRVSLDDLALEIAKVQDPVLHLVHNEDGSSSYVVVSGRFGPTTVAATTAAASTTTVGTTSPPARNATASYEALFAFLRPWILGRLFQAQTTSSAVGTESPVTTPGLSTTPTWSTDPAATPTMAVRMLTPTEVAITVPSAATSETGTPDIAFHGLPPRFTEDTATTTLFPAEFRDTYFGEEFALTDTAAYSNATITSTAVPSTVQPATQPPPEFTAPDTATPVATDAAPTPRTASTGVVFMGTTAAFPVHTAPTSSGVDVTSAGPADRTEAATLGTTAEMPLQSDRNTTLVTTIQPPVGDLREETALPSTTTASLPTSNQTFGGNGPSLTTARTTAEEPAYRFFYDPREVTQTF